MPLSGRKRTVQILHVSPLNLLKELKMIPLNTPPGTEIICINDTQHIFSIPGVRYIEGLDGLQKGSLYTIREWILNPHYNSPAIRLNEIIRPSTNSFKVEFGYNPGRFRLLDIHSSLTELLTSVLKNVDDFEKV